MHGIIHSEFMHFVTSTLGPFEWDALLRDTGTGRRTYLAGSVYPDEEILALVAAASRRTGRPAAELLEDFGSFIAPTLLSVYKPFVKPHWRTLDLLENTEQTIHKVVRMKNPGAAPPELKVSRPSRDEVMIVYTSPRRLCAVARGIAAGVARHYGERVRVTELECMHKGHRQCRISVKLLK